MAASKPNGTAATSPQRSAIVKALRKGRAEGLTDKQVAENILAVVNDPAWIEDPTLARALSHPIRGMILRLLQDNGPLSPVMASKTLDDFTLGTLAYHFRQLQRFGLIDVVETRQRRGAIEHLYALTGT